MTQKSEINLLIITYLSTASVGLGNGLLGVAWPSVRDTFALSNDGLGLILAAGTAGFFVSSTNAARLISRGRLGILLLAGIMLRIAGMLGFALSPGQWGVFAFSLLGGTGAGAIATGMNMYVASNHSAGRMNWLHAGYGVGATIGPLLMTGILSLERDWQWGYLLVAAVQTALAIAITLTLDSWQIRSPSNGGKSPRPQARSRETLALPAVWLGILLFFVYTGTELSGGNWTFTFLTEGRGVPATIAGLWVSIYWGTFTVGRILIGFAVDWVKPTALVRAAMLGSVLGAALIWWNPVNEAGLAGLAVLGFSMAPVFPTLLFTTTQRLGAEHAPNAIGFQMGAASLGSAAIPGLAGVLIERISIEVIGPFLVAGTLVMIALHEVVIAAARRRTEDLAPGGLNM